MTVDGQGSLIFTLTVNAQGTVDGDAMRGTLVGTVTGPDGTDFGTIPGTLTGTRITVQPMPSLPPASDAQASIPPAASASPAP